MKYSNELKERIKAKWLRNDGKALISSRVKHDDYLGSDIKAACNVDYSSMAEAVYCVLNDITVLPSCVCGNTVKFRRFALGYAEYCSVKCRANDKKWQETVKNTRLNRYGVEHIAQLDYERSRRKKQMKKLRSSFNITEESYKKAKLTKLERYGEVNTGWLPHAIESRVENGSMIPPEKMPAYRKYKNRVANLTNRQDLTFLEGYEKRGVYKKDNPDVYHVDHIFSVSDGFRNDVPPEIIASPPNLRCIPASDNMEKNHRSDMSIEQLYEAYRKWKKSTIN